ncbi:NAD(P) transhydrogenase subunit alpha [Salinimicrobium tongyeongense]|uniref:proton-translocating NAD(P)(+) transhydrogenase n=1 Tax=Salinimicrobium tongyeongense TaxID=2809707 RepID=A0ABY6NPY4_9FLAO|nr:NAD(P) transhydrogenase subunit alpha [Salinimicrobium tongyeongense]UZH54949.1 NAD(P) transhydrogenase subunit alpha [Salinimicrobium tongyeongense]
METITLIYIIVFSVFLGVEIISNVPAVLHTPLMSGSNAISGVIVVGAILMMLHIDPTDYLNLFIGGLAIFLGTLNISGGFFITSKMLRMFNSKKKNK